MMGILTKDRLSFTSVDNTEPFVVISVGEESVADNIMFYAKIVQDSDTEIFADVICFLTSGSLNVELVQNSSDVDPSVLPTFTGDLSIYSIAPSTTLNTAFDGGEVAILAIGQSNMLVRDEGSNDPMLDADPNVWQIAQRDLYLGLRVPGNPLYFSDVSQTDTNTTGISGIFAKLYSQLISHQRRVVIIPVAEGGTGFADNEWRQGDTQYAKAIAAINSFLARDERNSLAAILVHMGEEDTILGNASFETDLDTQFGTNLRADIVGNEAQTDFSKIPLIVGGLMPQFVIDQGGDGTLVQNALTTMPSRVAMTGFASSVGFTGAARAGGQDDVHFAAGELRTFGERYFTAYEFALTNTLEPAVPDTPLAPIAVAGDTTASASWAPPASFPVITGYDLQWRNNLGPPTTVILGDVLTHQVVGLTNDTDSIEFRVAGINTEGTGTYSAWSNAVVPVAASPFPIIEASSPHMFLLRDVNQTVDGSNRLTKWEDRSGTGIFLERTSPLSEIPTVDVDGIVLFDGTQSYAFSTTDVTENAHSYLVYADVDASLGHNFISSNREFFLITGTGIFALGTGPSATVRVQTTNDPGTGAKSFWMTRGGDGVTSIGYDQGGAGNEGSVTTAIVTGTTAYFGRHGISTSSQLSGSVHAVIWWESAITVATLKSAAAEIDAYIAGL